MCEKYDVIVIGGGPAGMFAAGFAALEGAQVLLLEKNRQCGAKLLITGKGRCNVTNSEPDQKRFSEHFGRNGKSFLTALYTFGVNEVVEFFEQRGLQLKVERGDRIFPAHGGAGDIQKILNKFVRDSGAEVFTSCLVKGIRHHEDRSIVVQTGREEFVTRNLIIATGGLSYPKTGSTGDGYRWAEALGHKLVQPEPSLVPVLLEEPWTAEVSHFNLKNIQISVRQKGKTIAERFGEAFFTHNGIGGPIILDLSGPIRAALTRGKVSLVLDLKPAVEHQLFDQRLQRELIAHSNKDFRNSLGSLLPKDMIPLFVRLSGIDPHKKCHTVSKMERKRLLGLFKGLEMQVTGCEGFDKAIVTEGGVSLRDIDMRTMRSKKVSNLFFAGEIVDLAGPTGGFNLQVCWSTGYLAGKEAAK
ncbi:MAG TPA: NAD(P)/FAD-dependent oxidoreductase [Geopsychrobacteraceae bacterium]|nr:NAD(P)/FAD-dependent oxidoreductase [Geopsychrobacteraceae bacterium]